MLNTKKKMIEFIINKCDFNFVTISIIVFSLSLYLH